MKILPSNLWRLREFESFRLFYESWSEIREVNVIHNGRLAPRTLEEQLRINQAYDLAIGMSLERMHTLA